MLRLVSILFLLFVLASCSPKYACKDRVDIEGEKCDPITTVYEKKMIGKDVGLKEEEREVFPKKDVPSTREKPKGSPSEEIEAVRSLFIEGEKPLRLPPRVIRIWIAPWEDAEGDLHQTSYIYSEISPRRGRWLFGEKETISTQPQLHPLGRIGGDSQRVEKEGDVKPKPQPQAQPRSNIQSEVQKPNIQADPRLSK